MDDFRALCAELTDFLAELPFGTCEELVVRARAALAADGSASVAGELSDDELQALADQFWVENSVNFEEEHYAFARAAIAADRARWGHQPAPPVAEEVGVLLRELRDAAFDLNGSDPAKAMLTRAADLLEQRHPAPVPVAEGEVGELIKCLRIRAAFLSEDGANLSQQGDAIYFTRAADLLSQRHPTPVPVGDRLPELRDMFHRILCVARSSGQRPVGNIELADRLISAVVSWSALPLPAGEVE